MRDTLITNISLKFTNLKFHSNLTGTKELIMSEDYFVQFPTLFPFIKMALDC